MFVCFFGEICTGFRSGGSWVRVAILITHIRGLLAPLITAHEPPSGAYSLPCCCCILL